MPNPTIDETLQSFQTLSQADFLNLDRFYFLGVFRHAMLEAGFDTDTAETVALHLPAVFPEGALTRKQILDLAGMLVEILAKTDDSLHANGFQDTTPFLINTVAMFGVEAPTNLN